MVRLRRGSIGWVGEARKGRGGVEKKRQGRADNMRRRLCLGGCEKEGKGGGRKREREGDVGRGMYIISGHPKRRGWRRGDEEASTEGWITTSEGREQRDPAVEVVDVEMWTSGYFEFERGGGKIRGWMTS